MPQERSHFRPEIQGLRAVAVVSVLIYHIWPTALPGGFVGVDIFFVISGYLITEVLLRDVASQGSIQLARFYGRRIKRLLPAATLVLVATAACYSLLPTVSWGEHANQILASGLYYQNWWLGFQAVDYLGSERAPGALQHFWSLSVEEQYYLVWPLLFVGIQSWLVKSKDVPNLMFGWLIGVIFALSLSYSIFLSHTEPEMAYFASTTRAWELALGGLLAVSRLNKPAQKLVQVCWATAGTFLIFASFFLITSESIFPGWIALLPTIGATLLIYAGNADFRLSPQTLLRSSPFQYLGDISYSLYLWHWPIIIFYQHLVGRTINSVDGVIILVLSCALAHQTKVLVEDPFRNRDYFQLSRSWPFILGCVCIAITAGAALYVDLAFSQAKAANADITSTDMQHFNKTHISTTYQPTAVKARQDRPLAATMGCHTNQTERTPRSCTFGNQQSDTHLVLIGDSHAAQWSPAFRQIVEANGWQLTVLTKSACAFAEIPVNIRKPPRSYDECVAWSQALLPLLEKLQPSHVIIAQSRAHRVYGIREVTESNRLLAEAYTRIWEKVSGLNIQVSVLADTPRMRVDVPECLSTPGNSVSDCSTPRDRAFQQAKDPVGVAAENAPNVSIFDFNDSICTATECPAVADGILIWRDSHHLTATFVKSLIPKIVQALRANTLLRPSQSARSGSFAANKTSQSEHLVAAANNALINRPKIYRDRCLRTKNAESPVICEYGDPDGTLHVLLAGDTRAGQWLPALRKVANHRALRITTAITYACPMGDVSYQDWDCGNWTAQLQNTLATLEPDIVIYSQSRGYRVVGAENAFANAQALADNIIQEIQNADDVTWVVMPDTPRMTHNATKCVAEHPARNDLHCSIMKVAVLPNKNSPDPMVLASDASSSTALLDLTPQICPASGNICPPRIENQFVWRSRYLVTAGFAASQYKMFDQLLY